MHSASPPPDFTGSCLCGAVQYEVRGKLRQVIACHCSQCRKTTGHFMAATATQRSSLTLTQAAGLAWYTSSVEARRGFCCHCGSTLFWDGVGRDSISIAAGTINGRTGVQIAQHIFVSDKGDYYDVCDADSQGLDGKSSASVSASG
jgi:hypothetical protein